MRDHRKLRAFQLADELAMLTYQVTSSFPKNELYGLTSQMRRAAVSVQSNIVEGCARSTESEYLRFLDIAFGSLRELHYQFGLAERLGFTKNQKGVYYDDHITETQKVLGSLIRSIRTKKP